MAPKGQDPSWLQRNRPTGNNRIQLPTSYSISTTWTKILLLCHYNGSMKQNFKEKFRKKGKRCVQWTDPGRSGDLSAPGRPLPPLSIIIIAIHGGMENHRADGLHVLYTKIFRRFRRPEGSAGGQKYPVHGTHPIVQLLKHFPKKMFQYFHLRNNRTNERPLWTEAKAKL